MIESEGNSRCSVPHEAAVSCSKSSNNPKRLQGVECDSFTLEMDQNSDAPVGLPAIILSRLLDREAVKPLMLRKLNRGAGKRFFHCTQANPGLQTELGAFLSDICSRTGQVRSALVSQLIWWTRPDRFLCLILNFSSSLSPPKRKDMVEEGTKSNLHHSLS